MSMIDTCAIMLDIFYVDGTGVLVVAYIILYHI